MNLTIEKVLKIISTMRENSATLRTVKTQEEAQEMTRDDPTGRNWKVGEEYYLINLDTKQFIR